MSPIEQKNCVDKIVIKRDKMVESEIRQSVGFRLSRQTREETTSRNNISLGTL
jgi:hypothetical protein